MQVFSLTKALSMCVCVCTTISIILNCAFWAMRYGPLILAMQSGPWVLGTGYWSMNHAP
jgi:hypothetical protein